MLLMRTRTYLCVYDTETINYTTKKRRNENGKGINSRTKSGKTKGA